MAQDNDKRVAGTGYIFNFYNDVRVLTYNYGVYLNTMLEIEARYPNKEILNNLEGAESRQVVSVVQALRQLASVVYIEYKSIVFHIPDENSGKVEKIYQEIESDFIIKTKDMKEFVLLMNQFLVNDIIQNLLETNKDYLKDLFQNEQKQA